MQGQAAASVSEGRRKLEAKTLSDMLQATMLGSNGIRNGAQPSGPEGHVRRHSIRRTQSLRKL